MTKHVARRQLLSLESIHGPLEGNDQTREARAESAMAGEEPSSCSWYVNKSHCYVLFLSQSSPVSVRVL